MFTDIKEFTHKNIITIGLVIVLLVATILRFKGLIFQSYWVDELFTTTISNPSNSLSTVYNMTVNDVHPPLYQTLLWAWYHLFGFNEYAGRALSATIGVLGVYAVYLLGKEFFNKEVGLYASVIASMNYFLIFYSQETRSYSLLFLLSTMSYVYLMKNFTDYSKKNFTLYLLFTVALVYTHYFGFFLVVTQVFVFIYYFIKEKRKHLAILALITAVTIIIALLPLMDHLLSHEGKKSFWIKKPSEWFMIDYMKAYVKNQYLEGIFVLFGIISMMYLLAKKEKNLYKNVTVVLIIWVIIGYLLPYIRSVTSTPLLTSRNTIIVIPALLLLIAYGVYLIKDNLLKTSALVVVVFFSLNQLLYSNYYHQITKQQWREVLYTINNTRHQIPIFDVFFDPLVSKTYGYKTYSKILHLDLNIQDSKVLNSLYANNTLPECFFIVDSHGDHISKLNVLQDKSIKKVLEINKHRAKGILYAYNIAPQSCHKLYTTGEKVSLESKNLILNPITLEEK